jgi:hypothetical protein
MMNSTNDDDDYFLSNAPENITDTNTSINSSFPIIIMPELLIIKGTEADAIQTSSSLSILSLAEKGDTLKRNES